MHPALDILELRLQLVPLPADFFQPLLIAPELLLDVLGLGGGAERDGSRGEHGPGPPHHPGRTRRKWRVTLTALATSPRPVPNATMSSASGRVKKVA